MALFYKNIFYKVFSLKSAPVSVSQCDDSQGVSVAALPPSEVNSQFRFTRFLEERGGGMDC